MTNTAFAHELNLHGPDRAAAAPSRAEAYAYCRRLAQAHYENFTVASWFLPRQLRPHFHAIYAYCRWADDLADETQSPAESLRLLDWWQHELDECYQGRATHPVFVALGQTIDEFAIPAAPFRDLLSAFRQDQHVTRYETASDVLDYCRRSANPVGRLVLHLGRCHDEPRAALSDSICTGLQLANFCQDVARDWQRGRVYLPQVNMRQAGYDEAALAEGRCNVEFRQLMAGEVAKTRQYLEAGWPLVSMLPPHLKLDVALFIRGGLAILDAIRRQDYDVLSRRPVLTKADKLRLIAGSWWRSKIGRRP